MTQIISQNGGGGAGGGDGDMKKSIYDPDHIQSNAFDYNNFINTPTIPVVYNAKLKIQKNGSDVAEFTANSNENKTANITVPTDTGDLTNNAGFITGINSGDVTTALGFTPANVNDVVKTSGNQTINGQKTFGTSPKVPSKTTTVANDGTEIATEAQVYSVKSTVDLLSGLGKFLSLWDCSTGQPISFPLSTPYTYTTGDWFMVETVSTATPPVNLMPTGSSYTGAASAVQDTTNNVEQRDVYIYDGTNWLFQKNNEIQVSFSDIAGSPSDNVELDNALDGLSNDIAAKQDALTLPATPTQGNLVKWGSDNETLVDGGTETSKMFILSSTSDLTTAQAAYDYAMNGGNPIIRVGTTSNSNFYWESATSSEAKFTNWTMGAAGATTNGQRGQMRGYVFTLSSGTVTAVTSVVKTLSISTSAPTSGDAKSITLVV